MRRGRRVRPRPERSTTAGGTAGSVDPHAESKRAPLKIKAANATPAWRSERVFFGADGAEYGVGRLFAAEAAFDVGDDGWRGDAHEGIGGAFLGERGGDRGFAVFAQLGDARGFFGDGGVARLDVGGEAEVARGV